MQGLDCPLCEVPPEPLTSRIDPVLRRARKYMRSSVTEFSTSAMFSFQKELLKTNIVPSIHAPPALVKKIAFSCTMCPVCDQDAKLEKPIPSKPCWDLFKMQLPELLALTRQLTTAVSGSTQSDNVSAEESHAAALDSKILRKTYCSAENWDPGGPPSSPRSLIPTPFQFSSLLQTPQLAPNNTLCSFSLQTSCSSKFTLESWFGDNESLLGKIKSLKELITRADTLLAMTTNTSFEFSRSASMPEHNLVTRSKSSGGQYISSLHLATAKLMHRPLQPCPRRVFLSARPDSFFTLGFLKFTEPVTIVTSYQYQGCRASSRTNLKCQALNLTGECSYSTPNATVRCICVTPPEMVAMAEAWDGDPGFPYMSTANNRYHHLTTATTIAAFLEAWTANHMRLLCKIWTRGLSVKRKLSVNGYFVVITASDMMASLEAWTGDPPFRLC